MATWITRTEYRSCKACDGTGYRRLNHATTATCYACDAWTDGVANVTEDTTNERWTSYERCVMDHDPFQSGEHTVLGNNLIGHFLKLHESQPWDY